MKAFALIRMSSGQPDLPQALRDSGETFNYVLCDRIPTTNWGAYLCAARGAVIQALDADYNGFVGIVAVTEAGGIRWGELDNPCAGQVRTRLNAWLEQRNQPTIPEAWTNRRVVRAIYRRANAHFDLAQIDILDVG